jgi:hypothetical protein
MVIAEQKEMLKPFIEKFSIEQKTILKNPEKYVGKAIEKTELICEYWKTKLNI